MEGIGGEKTIRMVDATTTMVKGAMDIMAFVTVLIIVMTMSKVIDNDDEVVETIEVANTIIAGIDIDQEVGEIEDMMITVKDFVHIGHEAMMMESEEVVDQEVDPEDDRQEMNMTVIVDDIALDQFVLGRALDPWILEKEDGNVVVLL
jgi:hypothetical protein